MKPFDFTLDASHREETLELPKEVKGFSLLEVKFIVENYTDKSNVKLSIKIDEAEFRQQQPFAPVIIPKGDGNNAMGKADIDILPESLPVIKFQLTDFPAEKDAIWNERFRIRAIVS